MSHINAAILLSLMAMCAGGCLTSPRNHESAQFYFGGTYEIVRGTAESSSLRFRPSTQPTRCTWHDGAIGVSFFAVPYGLRLRIQNRLPYAIALVRDDIFVFDSVGRGLRAELRFGSSLAPSKVPEVRDFIVPPDSSGYIDLDIVSPIAREQIDFGELSGPERGSLSFVDPLGPAFCSGYYMPENPECKPSKAIERLRGQQFAVRLGFIGTESARYMYRYEIKPSRLGTGPTDDPTWRECPED